MAAAALTLHQLRYLIAGEHGHSAAGHSYLPFVGLLAALLLACAGGQLLRLATAGSGRPEHEPALPFRQSWLLAATLLLAIFVGQELLEGLLSGSRAAGVGDVFAAGGWICVPLAIALGGLVAAALAGARAVVRAARGRRPRAVAIRLARSRRLPRAHRVAPAPLAANLAGRAPPSVC
jgi:hypothetical protein